MKCVSFDPDNLKVVCQGVRRQNRQAKPLLIAARSVLEVVPANRSKNEEECLVVGFRGGKRVAVTITDIGSRRRRNAERAHRSELSVAIKKTLRDCPASKKMLTHWAVWRIVIVNDNNVNI